MTISLSLHLAEVIEVGAGIGAAKSHEIGVDRVELDAAHVGAGGEGEQRGRLVHAPQLHRAVI